MQTNMTDDPLESFYEVSYETLLTLSFIFIILFLNKALYAFIQVATSFLFCSNVVALFIIPVLIWLTVSNDPLSYFIMVLLAIWIFSIVTYILKKIVGINIPASMTLSLLYFITTYLGAFVLGQII